MPHAHPSGFPPRSQHGEGQALALRKEKFQRPVARGPSDATRASERVSPAIVAWRGTGPRPTVKGAVLDTGARGPVPRDLSNHRSAGALGCHTRIRAGFHRDRCMARDRLALRKLETVSETIRFPPIKNKWKKNKWKLKTKRLRLTYSI